MVNTHALKLLCHLPLIGSCSQFCLILQPHRVAVPFPPTFASPWQNSFVQIHGGTTLLKAKFGITPQKRPKNDLNWGVGSSYGTDKTPLPNPLLPYEDIVGSSRPKPEPCQNLNQLDTVPMAFPVKWPFTQHKQT